MRTVLLLLACIAAATHGITLQACQNYCRDVTGYMNCYPYHDFFTAQNKTCFNLCLLNCFVIHDGACMIDFDYACCIEKVPISGNNDLKSSGCDKLFYPPGFFTSTTTKLPPRDPG